MRERRPNDARVFRSMVGAGPRWFAHGLSAALVLVSAAILGAWILLASVHWQDRYELDHVGGARIALAVYANEGKLYPDIYNGQSFGGTRFMPLPIVLQAAAAGVTRDYLSAGKLLGFATMLALLAAIFVVLRRLGCAVPLAAGLCATLLASPTGFAASFGLRADTLPLLFQVLAVSLVQRGAYDAERTPHPCPLPDGEGGALHRLMEGEGGAS